MYRMYFVKNLGVLIGILENAKYILGILQILIFRVKVRIQKLLDSNSSFYF
jgi:hypothetical protein